MSFKFWISFIWYQAILKLSISREFEVVGVAVTSTFCAPDFWGVVEVFLSIKIPKITRGITMIDKNKIFRIQDIIVYNADFLKSKFRKEIIDLIITSPPYNIGIDYGKYDDNKTYQDYLKFSRQWLIKCYKLLKNNGRLCVNVPIDTGKKGKRSIAADLTILAKQAGFKYKGTIVWDKQNSKNKHSMVFSKNLEVILTFYKNEWTPIKKEFKDWVNEIWKFSGENPKRVNHPAAYPIEVPKRLIKMLTKEKDVVFDPFSGSGTTMVASLFCNRKGIAVEIDSKYYLSSSLRIKNKRG